MTAEQLKSLFEYRDGNLIWKISPCNSIKVGDVAGGPRGPYLSVKVNRKKYAVHRLIFLMAHGHLPLCIDHIDGNKRNNLIENLRAATPHQNQCNRGKQLNNTSGYKGVNWHKDKGRWSAGIKTHGRQKHLGFFDSPELASIAYANAAAIAHGEFHRAA